MTNLKTNYEAIKEMLWTVYGIGSLLDGNDIVLYRDSESLGRVDARLDSNSINCGSNKLTFKGSPLTVSLGNSDADMYVDATIHNYGEKHEKRELKVSNSKGNMLSIEVSESNVRLTRRLVNIDLRSKEVTYFRQEVVSFSTCLTDGLFASHVATEWENGEKSEPYTYCHRFGSFEQNDKKKFACLTGFANLFMTQVRNLLPNSVDTFLELKDKKTYGRFRTYVLGDMNMDYTPDLSSELSRQYSKPFFQK